MKIEVLDAQDGVVAALSEFVEKCATQAIAERDRFTIGLSGGSLTSFLSTGLPSIQTDWKKWHLFFCDERHVPHDDADSTFGVYKRDLMPKVPLSEDQFYTNDSSLTVEDAAKDYTAKVKSVFGECDWPVFDLLLLGMGPDGHTCSLFPSHPLLEEKTRWIVSISDSPKPPPQRITMTFPVINKARNAAFAACGAGKSEMIKRVLEGDEQPPLPASLVQSQEVTWFLDNAAASQLSKL